MIQTILDFLHSWIFCQEEYDELHNGLPIEARFHLIKPPYQEDIEFEPIKPQFYRKPLFIYTLAFLLIQTLLVLFLAVRTYYVLKSSRPAIKSKLDRAHVVFFLGSGGHTGEMMRLLEPVDFSKYAQRTWIYSSGDEISAKRALNLDRSKTHSLPFGARGKYSVHEVPRAREVGQSWLTTPISSLKCLHECFSLAKSNPDVVVCNGPGSCVMLCFAIVILKILGLSSTRIIYIESLARVKSLSLSGRLLLPIADRFLVQWQHLAKKYKTTEYYGILV